ncbi:MAG: FAD-dependent monooxygenase [Gammaproteobacteria bacterium]|nr:FAD-dependent monooxygenase [Gammaproteobacteria bacterium]
MVSALTDFDVVVVGAGIVGIATACKLVQQFERVALIDNTEHTPWQKDDAYGLRVSAINLASIELLKQIDVWQDVQHMRAFPYRSMHVWEQNGGAQIDFNASDTSHSSLGSIVENQVLLTALNDAVNSNSNITNFTNNSLFELSAISESSMLVELDNGERLTAKLVIGADGQRSKVRECIGASNVRTHYEQLGLVCTVKTELDNQQTAWQCFTVDGPLALLPLEDNTCSIVWSIPEQKCHQLMALSNDEFNRQVSEAFENKLGDITSISERKSFPLLGAQATQYIDHRVVLVGDAAHAVHPLAGLGLNLGLADLAHLSELLQMSDRPLGSERVLRQYERARKSENLVMQRSLEMIDTLFREERPLVKQIRSIGVNVTNKALPLKLIFMRQALGVPV